MKALTLLLLALVASASYGMFLLMNRQAKAHHKGTLRRHLIAEEIASLLYDLTVLKEIREGRLSKAVEMLEGIVDTKALLIWHDINQIHPHTREHALNTLRGLAEYRQRFPRDPGNPADTEQQDTRSRIASVLQESTRFAPPAEPTHSEAQDDDHTNSH